MEAWRRRFWLIGGRVVPVLPFNPTDKHQLSQIEPRDALSRGCAVNRASDSALSLTMRAL